MTRYITAVISLIMLVLPVGAVSAVDYLQGDARLDIGYDESGAKRASIGFKVKIGDVEAFKIGFAEWFGVDPSQVKVQADVDGLTLIAGARAQLAGSPPVVYSDTLNTSALRRALQAAGAETLHVVAFLPPSPIAKIGELQGINLFGVLRHEVTVPVESLTGIWTVRFGWRYRDLAIYIATPVLFLVLFELALRRLRHDALATQGPDQPAAIFVCGKAHHLASLLFLVLWPGLILLIVPTRYLMYMPHGYEIFGLALVVFVPFLISIACTIWMRAALYPVFKQFPEPNWSRRELIEQGCVLSSLCLFQLVLFGGSVLMNALDRFEDVDTSVLAAVPIVAALTPTLSLFLYSRYLGTVVRTPETQYESKRCEELAGWLALKSAPPLALVYRVRSRLAMAIEQFVSIHALRTKRQSAIFVEARLLREAAPDELDVLLLTELEKVKETRWRIVSLVRKAYTGLIFPGLLLFAMGTSLLIGEGDSIKYLFNGWVLFAVIYLVAPAIMLAGRRFEMRLVREYTRKMDESVLSRLEEPEAHIRALFLQARINCIPLESPRWLRSLMAPSPMERIRHLAALRGISDECVAALREHIDATTDQTATDAASGLVADFDRLLIRLILFRAIPILAYLGTPILFAGAYHRVLSGIIPLWALLPLAASICAFIVVGGQNAAWRLGKRRIVEALQERITIEEFRDFEALPVRFGRVRRFGDMNAGPMDSAGLLYCAGDTLVYQNDDTRLTVHAAEIEKISVAPESGSFFPSIALHVDWRDRDANDVRKYRVQLLNPGTTHDVNRDTLRLQARLATWWRDELEGVSTLQEANGAHDSGRFTVPWTFVNAAKCSGLTMVVGISCAALALHTGWKEDLPFNWSASNSAFVAPAIFLSVAGLIAVFQWIYLRALARQYNPSQDIDAPLTRGV